MSERHVMNDDERAKWRTYLRDTPTYGTYDDRRQEYREVHKQLQALGLQDGDLIVDVGAGTCDFDRYLRTEALWSGLYWPIDGAVQGVNFMHLNPREYLPEGMVDWVVAIETIEHVPAEQKLLSRLIQCAGKGLVVTTPNGGIMDVSSLDPTHVDSYTVTDLIGHGLEVEGVTFSPDRPQPDTLIGWWAR